MKPDAPPHTPKSALADYHVWSYLAWQDIKVRYRHSRIGPFWITLSMAIFCVAITVIYTRLFKADVAELLPFMAVGMVAWALISGHLGEMPNLFVDNTNYIRNMRISLITIMLRSLCRNTIIFFHNLLIIVGVYLFFDIWPGWEILIVVPGLLLVLVTLIAMGVPLSILGARYRDTAQITQSVLQIFFFITPIFWLPRLADRDSWIVIANPFAHLIDLIRSPLLGKAPAMLSWLVTILMLLVMSLLAAWAYRAKRDRVPFWV